MAPDLTTALKDNIARVRERMAQAALQAGRNPGDILLCAVCKSQPHEAISLSSGMDIDLFGENREQEMRQHQEAALHAGKSCHFIGHLQTNKVRRVVGQVQMIQSVNSLRLLQAIAREAERQGIVQDILFEINVGAEDTKMGASAEDLWPLLDGAAALPTVRVRGLMSIPPSFDNSPESRRWFALTRELLHRARQRHPQFDQMDTLSMGMSDSFEAAILEGATLVRVGSTIYGKRAIVPKE